MSGALNIFLRDCATSLSATTGRRSLLFVMGNEGGDMDSVVGSLYLAYFLATQRFKYTPSNPSPVVPLLNFPSADLALRGDVDRLLASVAVDASLYPSCEVLPGSDRSNPTFVDLSEDALRAHPIGGMVLFDHNALRPAQAALAPFVLGCVDHHKDEGLYTEENSAKAAEEGLSKAFASQPLRTIETVGSAASLVAGLYSSAGVAPPVPSLLFGPVVLDTYNFDPEMKRVFPEDESAATFLKSSMAAEEAAAFDPKSFFERLKADKFDVSALTVPQAMRRDFKLFNMKRAAAAPLAIGISSHLEHRSTIVARFGMETLARGMLDHVTMLKLDMLMVMTAAEDAETKQLRRELLVLVPEGPREEELKGYIEAMVASDDMQPVGLAPMAADAALKVTGAGTMLSFGQGDATVSRKTLTPRLAQFTSKF